jgi:phosphopantetheinyl transferase
MVAAIHLDYQFNKSLIYYLILGCILMSLTLKTLLSLLFQEKKVGVDIEFKSADFDHGTISSDIFEIKSLILLKMLQKNKLFYTLWTRKEAL